MSDPIEAADQARCPCPMRGGAHEATCGRVGEYDHIHCRRCDRAVWMAGMSFGMCRDCQKETGAWGVDGAAATTSPPPDAPAVRAAVRAYILAEFLPGEDPAELTDDTPLVTGGILDYTDTMELSLWLTGRYGVRPTFPGDRDDGRFDSVARIAALVMERSAAREIGGSR